ncbi:protein claret segregational-like [Belonocnema kinseyi]|uniref:protein claret segregational-like n=1 Tax=Belonocnema kinseyi TaxID=2817044 RepID=UPI00143D2516|nr:protein claret segregational-like [Belonocnema kinseyi]XP_033220440.1 protein claret segregational-like [Belonocnema kinseyi]XP_033220441.1 protein claret segregational-like [Belonocnema kinseyi]
MESRLQQPKIKLIKAKSTLTVAGGSKIPKTSQISLASQSTSIATMSNIKNAASTTSINSRNGTENHPPKEAAGLLRSQTMSTILRQRPTQKAPLKRLGAGVNAIEAKRANITQRVAKPPVTTNNAKPPAKPAAKPAPKAANKMPAKWDLKGRLAYTTEELTTVKSQNKEMSSKFHEMQENYQSLQESESLSKARAEEFEKSNAKLNEDMTRLKAELDDYLTKNEDLTKKLQDMQEKYENVSESLKEYKERCSRQEELLKEQKVRLDDYDGNLKFERDRNNKLSTTNEDLQVLVHSMDKDRRILHNTMQEMKGNIRVFCRVRPAISKEASKPLCSINYLDECTIDVGRGEGGEMGCGGKIRQSRQEFQFDKVFPPNASQEDIFQELSLLVQSALDGYNVCVFAYGQTGSGKTYTMEGFPGTEMEGMIPRTVKHIFSEMKQFELLGWEYRIEASFLEIYNEHIVDLLDSQPKLLEIRMADSKGNDLYVSNLQVEEIHSPEELHKCLLIAQQNRAVAATQSNERSSRSHSVARIRLIGKHARKDEISIGNLNLVDLAGSERLKGEEAARTAETKNINKSLSNLGNVILALLKKQDHIPYRNSKLTHLLMPSLGGNSKTLMLLNISPLDDCYNETLNSLRFASNVNNCKTGTVKRTKMTLQNNSTSS